MSKKIEVLQYQKAVEALESALIYAPHLKEFIEPAIDNSKMLIDIYNKEDYIIHNPTNGELGKIKYALKKVVTTHFKDKLKNGRYFKDECKSLVAEVHIKCDQTIIPEDLIDSKIQILRKFPHAWTRSGCLENELNTFLNTKLLECFLEQHCQFIQEKLV
jgi:hypothetical protein